MIPCHALMGDDWDHRAILDPLTGWASPIMLLFIIYMLNMLNSANYALCSDCVIMPKSNASIIEPDQRDRPKIDPKYASLDIGHNALH